MKYYVVTYAEDDGWSCSYETIGVKTDRESAEKLMHEKEFDLLEHYGVPACDFDITIETNRVFYDHNGDVWFKVQIEEIEEVQ